MEWDMYIVDNCAINPRCPKPPYYPVPPPFASRTAPGFTYYDKNYRGGSHKEIYTERCIPIFPSYDPEFPCEFILVKEENKAYFITKNAPAEFDDCCILADPFNPPVFNFTEKMNYRGKVAYGDHEVVEFAVKAPSSGGDFIHGFYDNEETDFNGDPYYVPNYFIFTGTGYKELF